MNQNGQSTATVTIAQPSANLRQPYNANDISITITGQELFYSKLKQTFESMVRKSQSKQLSAIHDLLLNTDMVLRPDLHNQKKQIEQQMNPFRRMSTTLGSRKQHNEFEKLMEGDLVTLVEAQDCEMGIKLLVDTLKK